MKYLLYPVVVFLVVVHRQVSALELTKCHTGNSSCQEELFQNVAGKYAATGIPEIGIAPIDPLSLENVVMNIGDIFKLKMIVGECLDIGKTCTILSYENDIDNFRRIIEVVCDRIVIQGQYTLETRKVFGNIVGDVCGNGNGTIVLEDWYFKFDYPFSFVRREDGNIYTNAKFNESVWVSKVRRKATFEADNIMLNCHDVTHKVINFMNKYWKLILSDTSFGKQFHQISIDYYYDIYSQFFNSVPATEYYSDDLTPYLEENQTC